jgi:hypothetical protein
MKETTNDPVREYLAEIGARGGKVKGPKGFATLSKTERAANAKKAAATRWGTKKKKTGK